MTLFFASRGTTSLSLAAILERLDVGFTKAAGNPILPRGTAGQWDDAQVRDMRVVIDENGAVVEEVDGLWAYYGGYPDLTLTGAVKIGLAKSTDGGNTWTRYGSNPVASEDGSGWNSHHLGQPTVVKQTSGTRVMLAQGQTGAGVDSIGCLTSADGLTWTDQGQKLTLGQFTDTDGTAMIEMGVPSLIKRASGDWLCVFEALRGPTAVFGRWRIFGALANSPTGTWTPLKGGKPLLSSTGSGWESVGVANPSLIEVSPSVYAMLYNGANTYWQVGFAWSTDLVNWTRYTGNPVLTIGAGAAWDNQHVEASFLFKQPSAGVLRVLYNGFRTSDDSAAVGLATA